MGRSELQDVKQQFKRFLAEAPDFDVLDIERASEPAPAIEHDFTFVTRSSARWRGPKAA